MTGPELLVVLAFAPAVLPLLAAISMLYGLIRRRRGSSSGGAESAAAAAAGAFAGSLLFSALRVGVADPLSILGTSLPAASAVYLVFALGGIERGGLALVCSSGWVGANIGLATLATAGGSKPFGAETALGVGVAVVLGIVGFGVIVYARKDRRARGSAPTVQSVGATPGEAFLAVAVATSALLAEKRSTVAATGTAAGLVGVLIAATATQYVGLPWFVVAASAAVAFALAGTEASLSIWPSGRLRSALEVWHWTAQRELARLPPSALPLPSSAAEVGKWLEGHPATSETAGLRAELLLWAGRVDDARTLAAGMPVDSAVARFEKLALIDLLDWCEKGEGDLESLVQSAAAIPAGTDDRLRAEATIVLHQARRLLAADEDWLGLLAGFRAQIGPRRSSIRGRYRPAVFRVNLVVGAVLAFSWFGGFGWLQDVLHLAP
jgi:hypothetical protein